MTDTVSDLKIQKLISCNQSLASKLETIVDKTNSQLRDKDVTIDELTEKLIKTNERLEDRSKIAESLRAQTAKQESQIKSLLSERDSCLEREALLAQEKEAINSQFKQLEHQNSELFELVAELKGHKANGGSQEPSNLKIVSPRLSD